MTPEPCPGCGSADVTAREAPLRVDVWVCSSCQLEWASTAATMVVLPLPKMTRAQRRRGEIMNSIALPPSELINVEPLASVALRLWFCRLCEHKGRTASTLDAYTQAADHLVGMHRAIVRHG